MLRIRADRRVMIQDSVNRWYSVARDVAEDLGKTGTTSWDGVEIEVTNMGYRRAVIVNTHWRIPWLFRWGGLKAGIAIIPASNKLSDAFPWRLGDGDSAKQIHPEDAFRTGNADQWKRLAKGLCFPWLATRFIKVGATTTIGHPVESRLSPEMSEFFRKLIHEAKGKA